jgi:paraquat-inducible protein B
MVGEVMDCRLSDDPRQVLIQARIDQVYAPLVRVNNPGASSGVVYSK